MTASVRIEAERRFAVPRRAAFHYITDPANWPQYWPRLVSVDPESRWRDPGDRARVALRMLGREVRLDMRLVRIDPYQLVEYVSEQRGLPSARHWRHFAEAGHGLAFRIVVEYEPRPGWRGVLDRLLVRRAVERTVGETLSNLGRRFGEGADGVPPMGDPGLDPGTSSSPMAPTPVRREHRREHRGRPGRAPES